MTSYLKLIARAVAAPSFSAITVSGEANNDDDNTAATTEDVTWPATSNGQVAYLAVSAADAADPGAATATGFVQVASVHGGGSQDARVTLLRRVCDGTETGTLTVTIGSASVRGTVWLGVLSGVDTTALEPVTPTSAVGDETNPTFASITPPSSTQGAVLLVLGQREENNGSDPASTPTGYTELHNHVDDTVQANVRGLAVWIKDGVSAAESPAALDAPFDHWQTLTTFVQAATA